MKNELTRYLMRAIVGVCLILCAYAVALAAIWYKFGVTAVWVYNTVVALLAFGIHLVTSDGTRSKHEKDSDTL